MIQIKYVGFTNYALVLFSKENYWKARKNTFNGLSGIYMIRLIPKDEIYIGQSKNISQRM